MKTPRIALLAGVAAGLVVGSPAWAGAKLKIDDDSSIDLGFRVQAYTMMTDTDLDGDGSFDDETDFRVRRARLRAKLTVGTNRERTRARRALLIRKLLGNLPVVDLHEALTLVVRAYEDLLAVQPNAVETLAALDAEEDEFHG